MYLDKEQAERVLRLRKGIKKMPPNFVGVLCWCLDAKPDYSGRRCFSCHDKRLCVEGFDLRNGVNTLTPAPESLISQVYTAGGGAPTKHERDMAQMRVGYNRYKRGRPPEKSWWLKRLESKE
jgi:hypothetical protein